jgi:broad specificity phosphatase PhoE
MNHIDYKSKYIKYKTKYLNFIKQHAGEDDITVVLLCSHQGRISCLIHSLTGKKLEKNFKNCCIIELSIINGNITLKIVYVGDVVCNEGCSISNEQYYEEIIEFTLDCKAQERISKLFKKNTIIYIVRHADGEHLALKRKGIFAKIGQNISDVFKNSEDKLLRDARLTLIGEKQAINAGEKLNNLLDKKSIDFIFFSDLERTRQTIAKMLSKIDNTKIKAKAKAIILPCSHEVGYKENGSNCDGQGFFEDIKRSVVTENIPRVDKIEDLPKKLKISKEIEINIDSDIYSEFYNPQPTDGSTEQSTQQLTLQKVLRHKSSVNKCENLTMLEQIAQVINE